MTTTIILSADEYDALLAERERLAHQLRVTTVERDLLKERLDAFLRRFFAAKSEARANPAQRDLFLNEAEVLAPTAAPIAEETTPEGVEVAGFIRKKRGRKPLDPSLPREMVRHELPESERVCAHDGTRLVEIGTEISEQLDIIPQQVRVIPKGLLTESTLAWVVTAKYQDALPLYRQAALLGRFGGNLSRNTLAASMIRVSEAVQPIINLLRDHLFDADLVLGDETVVQVLKESGRSAQSKSYLWAQMTGSGPPIRLQQFSL